MMVDNTENNEFRELLSAYTAPIEDDGFAAQVLLQAEQQTQADRPVQNATMIKNLMLGSAAVLATLFAAPHLAKVKTLIASIHLPEFSAPANVLDTSSTSSMMVLAMLAVLMIGIGSSFVFGKDV